MANQISIPKVQTTDRNVNQLQQNIISAVNQLQQQVNSANDSITTLNQPAAAPKSKIVKSNSTGNVFSFSNTQVPILDQQGNPLSVAVTTTGEDVDVGLMSDGRSGQDPGVACDQTPTDSGAYIFFYRDGIFVNSQFMYMQNNISIEIMFTPSSAFRFIDSPPAGTHVYTVQALAQNPNRGDTGVYASVLYARPY